jgi:hypothetical protein
MQAKGSPAQFDCRATQKTRVASELWIARRSKRPKKYQKLPSCLNEESMSCEQFLERGSGALLATQARAAGPVLKFGEAELARLIRREEMSTEAAGGLLVRSESPGGRPRLPCRSARRRRTRRPPAFEPEDLIEARERLGLRRRQSRPDLRLSALGCRLESIRQVV